jgi:tetratricopeptide (TPR) repeat protein
MSARVSSASCAHVVRQIMVDGSTVPIYRIFIDGTLREVRKGYPLPCGPSITTPPRVTLLIGRRDRKATVILYPSSSMEFVEATATSDAVDDRGGSMLISVVRNSLDFFQVTYHRFIASVRGTVFRVVADGPFVKDQHVTITALKDVVSVSHPAGFGIGSLRNATRNTRVSDSGTGLISLVDSLSPGRSGRIGYRVNSADYRVFSSDVDAANYYAKQVRSSRHGADRAVSAAAYNNRGLASQSVGASAEALRDYSRAIELEPRSPTPLANRGYSRFQRGNYDQAIADFTAAIQLDPYSDFALDGRGMSYYSKGDYDRAIADFTTAINQLVPRLPLYRGKIIGRDKFGRYAQIIPTYRDAIEFNFECACSYLNRGEAYLAKRLYGRAIHDFNSAIQLEPKSNQAFAERGLSFSYQRDFRRAFADLDKAVRMASGNSEMRRLRARAYEQDKQYAKALDDYNKAIAVDYLMRGKIYYGKENLGMAIADYNAAISVDPSNGDAYAFRAAAFMERGDIDEAIVDYSAAIHRDPTVTSYVGWRGRLYLELGSISRGRLDLVEQIRKAPKNDATYSALWLEIANRRLHKPSEIAADWVKLHTSAWPAPVFRMFLNREVFAKTVAEARDKDPLTQRGERCEAYFFGAERARWEGNSKLALQRYRVALATCPHGFFEWAGARAALGSSWAP